MAVRARRDARAATKLRPGSAAAPRLGPPEPPGHPAREFWPESRLVTRSRVPERARFPVVDAHNHYWDYPAPESLLRVMDDVGVRVYVNVTGNTTIRFDDQGYRIHPSDFGEFKRAVMDPHPGRFAALTMSGFAKPGEVLFDAEDVVDRTVAGLERDVRRGACGLKVLKSLGLQLKDRDGTIVRVDDRRLDPVWEAAGRLGVPVLIHTGDPEAFFDPADERNEQIVTLRRFPDWSFHGSRYSNRELLEQRDRVIARHPRTRFLLPHVASLAENLAAASKLLERFANVSIDVSARLDELGRQPYTAREFMVRWQDRILFGADMHVSTDVYRCHFRFLETRDEDFAYPNYTGGWDLTRWRICGLGLPDGVLRKIYHRNALRLFPGIDSRMF